ncbi:MAG TPA: nucleotidyltransferase [Gaiellaceae bacterium]
MTEFDDLLETLKRAAAAMRDADVPFLLGGGLAVWARGGPETEHDLDFMVKPEDADRALEALAAAGFRTEKPPEEWLYKGWEGDLLIDLIFDPAGNPVDDAMFERADDLEVQAVAMKVMSLEDVMVTKLLAMREHEVDFDDSLEFARALREQIDWDTVWAQTSASPFARAFFYLVEQLDILDGRRASPSESGSSQAPSEAARRA